MKQMFNRMLSVGSVVAGTMLVATMLSAQAPGGAAPGGAPAMGGGFQMPPGGFQMPEGGFQMPPGGFQMPEGGFPGFGGGQGGMPPMGGFGGGQGGLPMMGGFGGGFGGFPGMGGAPGGQQQEVKPDKGSQLPKGYNADGPTYAKVDLCTPDKKCPVCSLWDAAKKEWKDIEPLKKNGSGRSMFGMFGMGGGNGVMQHNGKPIGAKQIADIKYLADASNAQVTRGGIREDEFSPDTLESKRCRNLFAVGEILNVDGDCGGFNLQFAFASGLIAGQSAAEKR